MATKNFKNWLSIVLEDDNGKNEGFFCRFETGDKNLIIWTLPSHNGNFLNEFDTPYKDFMEHIKNYLSSHTNLNEILSSRVFLYDPTHHVSKDFVLCELTPSYDSTKIFSGDNYKDFSQIHEDLGLSERDFNFPGH